jgi:hypothetical protein
MHVMIEYVIHIPEYLEVLKIQEREREMNEVIQRNRFTYSMQCRYM